MGLVAYDGDGEVRRVGVHRGRGRDGEVAVAQRRYQVEVRGEGRPCGGELEQYLVGRWGGAAPQGEVGWSST